MSGQSDSEIVFSSQDLDNSNLAPRILRPQDHSPNLRFNVARRNIVREDILPSSYNQAMMDLNSSGKKRQRKGSDEIINDMQARRADQLQKYNVCLFENFLCLKFYGVV